MDIPSKKGDNMGIINVITIAREYGSGGRTVGHMIADKLGFRYIDKEILRIASDESGINEKLFAKADEEVKLSIFDRLSNKKYKDRWESPESGRFISNDNLFKFQSEAIEKLSEEGNCVIVGRCADYILREKKNVLKAFIHSPMSDRIDRIMELSPLDSQEAASQINKIDSHRAQYYEYYTNRKWDCAENYDICLNTGALSFEQCRDIIIDYMNICEKI